MTMSAADVDRHHDALGELLDRAPDERRVRGGRRAEDRACRPVIEHGGRRFQRTDPPADLDGHDDRPADLPHGLPVLALAERGVEIDHVEPASTLLLEPLRDLDRVVVVGGLRARVPAAEPHRSPASQVDGRDHDHPATAFTKFA